MSSPSTEKNVPIAVRFKDVVFGYEQGMNVPTINKISFEIPTGKYICIVGGNGSGKSTISKLLVGLLKPWSGQIQIFNTVLDNYTVKSIRNDIGIVFQNPDNQFIGLTAEDDIAFGLENHKINPTMMYAIIENASSIVNVKHLLGLNAGRLSGGQKQRVAIASVLALNPKVIIFDESTSMLDPTAKTELMELMVTLRQKYHKTIISITHNMEEMLNADLVMVIKNGTLQKLDEPKTVFENEEFLANNKLNLPFALELSKNLKAKDERVNLSLEIDQVIENINNLCK
ncbi:MAG: energy-coupling factor transporter ATPase [Mycoplasma sp.]